MNFLFCNRCNKKSEDNILNFNSTEILLNNSKPNIMGSSSKKIESIDEFQNYGENIITSLNNLHNAEEDKEELEIIEYPYTKKEKNSIKPKQFKNNKSRFDAPDLIEQDILHQLNHFVVPKKNITNKKNDIKIQNKKKVTNIRTNIRTNSNNLEHKDTMTDPANLALSSLIKDINRKISPKIEEKNIENLDKEEDIVTINDEIEEKYNSLKNNNKNNKSQKNIIAKKDINAKNIKKDHTHNKKKNPIKKNKKSFNNTNNTKIYDNLISKMNQKKLIKNKKVSEYNNNIIKKKNILRNKGIFSNNTKNNFGVNPLCLSTKKQFPKSYSFNCFNSERKNNEKEVIKKDSNNNALVYSCTIKKKNMNLKINDRISSAKNKNKNENSNKTKLAHKKISRGQIPIQKACSSHISS